MNRCCPECVECNQDRKSGDFFGERNTVISGTYVRPSSTERMENREAVNSDRRKACTEGCQSAVRRPLQEAWSRETLPTSDKRCRGKKRDSAQADQISPLLEKESKLRAEGSKPPLQATLLHPVRAINLQATDKNSTPTPSELHTTQTQQEHTTY